MTKKKTLYTLGIILFLVVCFLIYSKITTPILIDLLPERNTISSIDIKNESNTKTLKTENEIEDTIQKLSKSKLTRKKSVSDFPLTDNYTTISLNSENGEVTKMYLYQENKKYFIELPYQGIYRYYGQSF